MASSFKQLIEEGPIKPTPADIARFVEDRA
jgi:hypothetical protein